MPWIKLPSNSVICKTVAREGFCFWTTRRRITKSNDGANCFCNFSIKETVPISSFTNTMSKVITADPKRTSFTLPVADDRQKVSGIYAFELNWVSYSPRNQALWEDPDDGSGSEYDDDNEGNNLDFEEDEESVSSATASCSADKPSTTTDKSAEDLLKEVEQLLGPEERDILQHNATPNLGKISTAKWNPFHSLGLAGQIHYMDMLLGNGLPIDLADKDGMTALHTAIIGKKEAVISHLLRKGANPNIGDRDGASPLHYAVQVGGMQTVKLLIKYNVDVNASDNEGWTPLHIAIQTRNRDIAKVLLVNGADKTRRNKDGKTPLDLALCYGKDFKSYDLAKLLKLVPANRFKKLKPVIEGEPYDIEDCSSFPMVLVQIPICNERELDWPKNRFLVQVLDDSDVESLQNLIRNENGYKAGNLLSAMGCDYVKDYEFVAIFDADFQPNPDFLKLTIPHFKGNPEVGLVQAHWSFVNKDENLLTRLQNVNLCFHLEVERQFNGMFINFFGFNGTAGVWRIKALEESGGWFERTTVEDMDIPVRAHLNGWKFIFLNDVRVLCELPESYEAYQSMFIPEAELPLWVVCYVPVFMSFLNVLPSPKSFPFLIPYLLFENTMSGTEFNAMVSGLFQLGSG
ncbi:unnamed protein product [Camellia sinensis]